ncbi:glycosyltransferase family 4 protein [Diaminobutyricibacter sp. McL0608]|uniref:glycosyltransferase family 4 protein n=1 Tax=Leifsonia sp. McL0608 TaxID=3143537 RepID=UPI0031F2D8DA
MTRVLVDLLYYTGTKGGMESYARNLYRELGSVDSGLEFVGFASTELAETDTSWFPGDVVASRISGENRVSWARGELTAVSRAARRLGAGLIHSPANIGPWRSTAPVVLTVHDLLPFRHPEWVPGPYAPVLRGLVRGAARSAARVITVSRASGDDIERVLGVPPERIDVIPLAGSARTLPDPGIARDERLLLSVGNRMPHKNFRMLLEAIALIPDAERPRLVITGSHGDDPLAPVVERLGLADRVQLLGWVPDAELERLYATASLIVFPTLFEGFGLPVLEAMARGCPVICSDLPVLREIGGGAAVYSDPTSASGLAHTIRRLLADPAKRRELSTLGRERAAGFTWTAAALSTVRSFQRTLDAS